MSVFICAEAGINHCGRLITAFKLCDSAKACGADAVKFQHFSSQALWKDDRIAHLELRDAFSATVRIRADPYRAPTGDCFLDRLKVYRVVYRFRVVGD